MSLILRWFHDGDVRYRAYFNTLVPSPDGRQLIIATRSGEAMDITLPRDRELEDFSEDELVNYARLLHGAPSRLEDAAAD
jgi:hypothetical protein